MKTAGESSCPCNGSNCCFKWCQMNLWIFFRAFAKPDTSYFAMCFFTLFAKLGICCSCRNLFVWRNFLRQFFRLANIWKWAPFQFSAYFDDTCSFAYSGNNSSLPGPQSAGYDSAFPFPRAPSAYCLAVFAWYTRFLRGTNFRQDKDNLGGQQTFYERKYVSLAKNCVTWIHFPISRALRTIFAQKWKSWRSD